MAPVLLNIGLATIFPAVDVSYQITVCPTGTVAVAVKVCIGKISHCVISPPVTGATGAGLMVNITAVLVNEGQIPSLASA